MKPVHVRSSTQTDFNKGNDKKDLKFEAGGHVKISKYKNIFAKGHVPNWSEENFVVKKLKNTVPGHVIVTVKKLLERFTKKNCKEQMKKSFELKKLSR